MPDNEEEPAHEMTRLLSTTPTSDDEQVAASSDLSTPSTSNSSRDLAAGDHVAANKPIAVEDKEKNNRYSKNGAINKKAETPAGKTNTSKRKNNKNTGGKSGGKNRKNKATIKKAESLRSGPIPDDVGKNPLLRAIKDGDLEKVKDLVEKEEDITARTPDGRSVINLAGEARNRDILEILLKKAEVLGKMKEVNRMDNQKRLPCHCFVESGWKAGVELLLEFFEEGLTDCDGNERRILHIAAWFGKDKRPPEQLEMLKYLIEITKKKQKDTTLTAKQRKLLKYGVNVRDKLHQLAIHLAVLSEWPDGVAELLSAGTDIRRYTKENKTAIHLAASVKNIDILKMLLDKDTTGDVVNMVDKAGASALHVAVQQEWEAGVKMLLDYKANIKLKTGKGKTALHLAAASKDHKILEVLLDHVGKQEDPEKLQMLNEVDSRGLNALFLAVVNHGKQKTEQLPELPELTEENTMKNIEMLIDAGADVTWVCMDQKDPKAIRRNILHKVAELGHDDVMALLFRRCATEMDKLKDEGAGENKATPLLYATQKGHKKCVEILLSKGVDLEIKGSKGECSNTAFHIAVQENQANVVQVFLNHFQKLKKELEKLIFKKWFILNDYEHVLKYSSLTQYFATNGHVLAKVSSVNEKLRLAYNSRTGKPTLDEDLYRAGRDICESSEFYGENLEDENTKKILRSYEEVLNSKNRKHVNETSRLEKLLKQLLESKSCVTEAAEKRTNDLPYYSTVKNSDCGLLRTLEKKDTLLKHLVKEITNEIHDDVRDTFNEKLQESLSEKLQNHVNGLNLMESIAMNAHLEEFVFALKKTCTSSDPNIKEQMKEFIIALKDAVTKITSCEHALNSKLNQHKEEFNTLLICAVNDFAMNAYMEEFIIALKAEVEKSSSNLQEHMEKFTTFAKKEITKRDQVLTLKLSQHKEEFYTKLIRVVNDFPIKTPMEEFITALTSEVEKASSVPNKELYSKHKEHMEIFIGVLKGAVKKNTKPEQELNSKFNLHKEDFQTILSCEIKQFETNKHTKEFFTLLESVAKITQREQALNSEHKEEFNTLLTRAVQDFSKAELKKYTKDFFSPLETTVNSFKIRKEPLQSVLNEHTEAFKVLVDAVKTFADIENTLYSKLKLLVEKALPLATSEAKYLDDDLNKIKDTIESCKPGSQNKKDWLDLQVLGDVINFKEEIDASDNFKLYWSEIQVCSKDIVLLYFNKVRFDLILPDFINHLKEEKYLEERKPIIETFEKYLLKNPIRRNKSDLNQVVTNENNLSQQNLRKYIIHTTCEKIKKTLTGVNQNITKVIEELKLLDYQPAGYFTPLQIACIYRHKEMAKLLVDAGADLSTTCTFEANQRNTVDMLICRLPRSVDLLEEMFNSRIRSKKWFCEVDYRILLPTKLENGEKTIERNMKVIDSLVQSGYTFGQQKLLEHPLVTSFLELQWRKIAIQYYFLLIIYMLFLACSNGLVINRYVLDEPSPGLDTTFRILTPIFMVFLMPILISDLVFIFKMNFTRNRSQMILKLLCYSLILAVVIKTDCPRQVAAFGALLTWAQVIFLCSRIPRWGYYMLTYIDVVYKYLKFIISFSFIIAGFVIAFMVTFKVDNSSSVVTAEEPFNDTVGSIVKTVVMMTSEYDYKDLFHNLGKEGTFALVCGRILFLLFIFVVVIVLTNLLIAKAVIDLPKIGRLRQQANFISMHETIPILGSYYKYIRQISLCCARNLSLNFIRILNSKFQILRPTLTHLERFFKRYETKIRDVLIFHIYLNETREQVIIFNDELTNSILELGGTCERKRLERFKTNNEKDEKEELKECLKKLEEELKKITDAVNK